MKLQNILGCCVAVLIVMTITLSDDLVGQTGPATYRPQVGKPHPDFVLPRIDNGKPLRLSDFRGKKVLLVHFASW